MKNIWVPVSGQIAQAKRIDTLSNNIANANTQGFKKDNVVFKEYLTALNKDTEIVDLPRKDWSPDDFYRTQGAENALVEVAGSFSDFTQGNLVPTGNPLDIALSGNGFFEVMTPHGLRLTRNSPLSLSSEGYLVTNSGHQLLLQKNDGKSEIEQRLIKLENPKFININTVGEIYTDKGLVGKISVVEPKNPHALRKEGNSLYFNPHQDNIAPNTLTEVKQGFVEQSNVNAIYEMSELIKAHRHFDNIQKAIKTYDSITGNEVNDIANI